MHNGHMKAIIYQHSLVSVQNQIIKSLVTKKEIHLRLQCKEIKHHKNIRCDKANAVC